MSGTQLWSIVDRTREGATEMFEWIGFGAPPHLAIVSKTARMNESGTFSWKRSDIELTKTRRGVLQRAGSLSAEGTRRISPVHCGPLGAARVSPS